MTEPWIRVHANLAEKRVAIRASEALNIALPEAIGLLVCFWGAMSRLGNDGHVNELTDREIEIWAGWTRKRGAFAGFVREQHTDAEGRVNEWDEYNGALEARREKDRDRQRKWRDKRRESREMSRGTSKGLHADANGDVTRDATCDATCDVHVTSAPTHTRARGHETKRNETKELSSSELVPPSGQLGSSSASASAPHFASLSDLLAASADIAAFCRGYYRSASPARKADVGRQLLEALNGGTVLRGQRVQAYTLERLEAKCREVLEENVRDSDKAIVVLLAKLADTSDGSAPGAQQAAAVAETARRDEVDTARDLEVAEAWLRSAPGAVMAIETQLDRDFPGELDEVVALARLVARNALVLEAWRRRSPDPANTS